MPPKKKTGMTKTEFARSLVKYLAIKGNSVSGMADELGITRMTIYRWKKGERNIDTFTADAVRKFFAEKLND